MARTTAENSTKVIGLSDLQRELRKLDKKLPSELKKVNLELAQKFARRAQGKARGLGSVAAKSAPAIKASAEQRFAIVRLLAGKQHPFAFGAEFGGGKHGKGNPTPQGGYTSQFKPWRGDGGNAGYFLYPTIRNRNNRRDDDDYLNAIEQLAKSAFPD